MSNDKILQIIAGENFDENALVELLFNRYRISSKNKGFRNDVDFIPQNLIKLYYQSNDHSDFSYIVDVYKQRYLSQESKLEQVHSKKEVEGLGEVYDYIRGDEWKKNCNILLAILVQIHKKLFSKVPHPEAGGAIRNINVYLPGTGISTSNYDLIIGDIMKLQNEFNELIKEGTELGINNEKDNEDRLIRYINKCIKLKCQLIKIHPFLDGNGRTMRALLNILFKIAGLPPVYIKVSERIPYQDAMNKAIIDENYSLINKLYYYKICDSILELDISSRKGFNTNTKVKSRSKTSK